MSKRHEPIYDESLQGYVFTPTYAAAARASHDVAKLLNVRLGTDLSEVRERIQQAIDEVVDAAAPPPLEQER